jgi:hypothetical protein
MGSDVLNLQEVDQTQVALVGGKAANLGELSLFTEQKRRVQKDPPYVRETLWVSASSALT